MRTASLLHLISHLIAIEMVGLVRVLGLRLGIQRRGKRFVREGDEAFPEVSSLWGSSC